MSKKILITGSNGFVARHLVSALKAIGDEIVGVDVGRDAVWAVDRYYGCNLLGADMLASLG